MRRTIGLVLALMLCISLAAPAYAAENGFVPSITYKGEPDLIPSEDEEGNVIIGEVHDKRDHDDKDKDDKDKNGKDKDGKDGHGKGKHVSYIYKPCLVITPVAKAETSQEIPAAAAQELVKVYKELSEGKVKLPYDKVDDYKGEDMVILELLDATWLCGGEELKFDHDHPKEVAPEGVVFDVTFDLGVAADAFVTVMTYHDGEWSPIVEVVNNGDGTVTCTFEHFCPIAISVAQGPAPAADSGSSAMPWVAVMLAALAGLVGLFLGLRKKRA